MHGNRHQNTMPICGRVLPSSQSQSPTDCAETTSALTGYLNGRLQHCSRTPALPPFGLNLAQLRAWAMGPRDRAMPPLRSAQP